MTIQNRKSASVNKKIFVFRTSPIKEAPICLVPRPSMTDKTFREKYVDQEFDLSFFWTLMTEFISTTIFIFTIMNLAVLRGIPTAYVAFAVACIGLVVIYAFGPRVGTPFNPAIVVGLVLGGKMSLLRGKSTLLDFFNF